MENYVIYVNNVGFFESMGHNGIYKRHLYGISDESLWCEGYHKEF